METYFSNIFKNTSFPVIVCKYAEGCPIVFANVKAHLLFDPHHSVNTREAECSQPKSLHQLVRFEYSGVLEDILSTIRVSGVVDNYKTTVLTLGGNVMYVSLFVNLVSMEEDTYLVMYVNEVPDGNWSDKDFADVMSRILEVAYHTSDAKEAIQHILKIAGQSTQVSRTYIFEEISPI